ncbi:MAG: class I SAM-dependent methyltransferase [Polyangiaceae bacterium]|nr:class I SAM-dependent methyltransferase [Polyangiaceae bacterium]
MRSAAVIVLTTASMIFTGCTPSSNNSPTDAPNAAPSASAGDPHHGHGHGNHAHHGNHGAHAGGPLIHGFSGAENWAKEFDSPERDAWQKPTEVVSLLQLAPGMKVADIGAGTGYFEPHLSRAVTATGRVFAIDVEPDMVRYLNERIARENLTNVTASKGAFEDPGLAAQSVDRIVIVDTWHHIANRDAYAKKLADALVPGGFVAIVDFTMEASHGPPKEMRLAPEAIQKELQTAGFVTSLATETLPDQYVVIGTKPK